MASYGPAIDRIDYLLFDGKRQATPNTLTVRRTIAGLVNGQREVLSYALPIVRDLGFGTVAGETHAETVLVHPRNSTPTTNRHIDAAQMLLLLKGFEDMGTNNDGWIIFTRGMTPANEQEGNTAS